MNLGPKSHAPVTVTDTSTVNLTINPAQVLSADLVAGSYVSSITGTANQVLANGNSGTNETGAVTLTTPQDLHTTTDFEVNTLKLNNFTAVAYDASMSFAMYDSDDQKLYGVALGDIATAINPSIDHGALAGLSDDDHSQYALLAGRAGGQTLIGGTASGEDLTLSSTAHATKGSIFLGSSSLFEFDQTTGRLNLPTTGSSAGLMIGGDAFIYRSNTQRLAVSNTELYIDRSYGSLGSGIKNALFIDASAQGDGLSGGPDIRALSFTVYGQGTNNISGLGALTGDVWVSGSAGNIGAANIASANLRVNSGMGVSSAYGYRAIPLLSGTGTVGTWRAFEARTPTRSSTGTITTSIGLDVASMGVAGGTTAYGIRVQSQTGSSTNYGIYFVGTGGTPNEGITWNGDTNIYRGNANLLQTDDSINIATAGSVSAPSIRLNDTNTGFYSTGTDGIGITAGGTQMAVFTWTSGLPGSGTLVINESQVDQDFRVEGDSMSHAIFLDATTSTENLAFLTTAAPNWQSMDGGIFIGNASTVPTGDPTSGGFLYVESGALKYRGSGGTITTIANA